MTAIGRVRIQTLVENKNQERKSKIWRREMTGGKRSLLGILLTLLVPRVFGHVLLPSSCFNKQLFMSFNQIHGASTTSTLPRVPTTSPLIPHPGALILMLRWEMPTTSTQGSARATPEDWEKLPYGANLWSTGYGSWKINSYPLLQTDGLSKDEIIHSARWKTLPGDWVINHAEYWAVVCLLTHSGEVFSFSLLPPSSPHLASLALYSQIQ